MDKSYSAIDEQNQRSFGPDSILPRRIFSMKITKSLGIIQYFVGISCLVLAICFPKIKRVNNFNVNEGRNSCNCSGRAIQPDPINLLDNPVGLKKNRLSISVISMGILFIINGAIGVVSALKRKNRYLNLANFFLGIPSILLSLCGVFLCTYATFIDAKNYKSSEVPFIIAGMQISCYIESVTSLFIVINCWMQMDSKSCKCTCACMGIQCACGDDSMEERWSIHENKSKRDEESNGSHDENEGEDAQSTAHDEERKHLLRNPINDENDDTYVRMDYGSGGRREPLRNCYSEGANNPQNLVVQAMVYQRQRMPRPYALNPSDQRNMDRDSNRGADGESYTYSNADALAQYRPPLPQPKKSNHSGYEDMTEKKGDPI